MGRRDPSELIWKRKETTRMVALRLKPGSTIDDIGVGRIDHLGRLLVV